MKPHKRAIQFFVTGGVAALLIFAISITFLTSDNTAHAAACSISSFGGTEVTYDFEGDTVGETPADVTVRSGSFEVADHGTLGKSLHPLTQGSHADNSNGASLAALLFDKVPTTTEDVIVTFKHYDTSAHRSFITMREDGNNKYAGQINNSASLLIYKVLGGSASDSNGGSHAAVDPDWFKFAVIGSTVTLCHSEDGSSYEEIASWTDGSPLTTGTVGFEGSFAGTDPASGYYDDFTIEHDAAPAAGITVTESDGSTDVTENGTTDSFDVVLDGEPANDVSIAVASSDETNGATVSPSTLTFTAGNWDSAQTVTVSAVDDEVEEGSHTATSTLTVTSDDADYDGIEVDDVTIDITDNDVLGVSVTESGGSTNVTENGATDSYDIVLDSAPSNTVTITPSSADETNGVTVSPSTLTFTTDNWDSVQTVTVSAVDDEKTEGGHDVSISHTASSDDDGYDGISISSVTASVTDNEFDTSYSFDSDTVGQAPADVTLVRGTAAVVDDATLGSNAMRLNDESRVDVLLDNIPTTSTELDVRFRLNNNDSDTGRIGVVMFANDDVDEGYLVQFEEDGSLETFKRTSGGPYNHSGLDDSPLSGTTDNKWRLTATTSDSATTITLYSWDGSDWQQEVQVTDSSSPHTQGGVAFNQIDASDTGTVDDVNVNYVGGDVSISSVSQYEIIQRNDHDEADIPVSGSYTGSPSGIEARFNGGAWQTIDASPSDGSYSGTLSGQSVGQGDLEVRYVNDTDANYSISNISVGDIYVITGQSNADGRANNAKSFSHDTLTASVFNGSWSEMGTDSSVWPIVATRISENSDVPVGMVLSLASGGTSMSNWQKGGSLYSSMTTQINGIGDIKAVIYWQGERDMKGGTGKAAYKSSLNQFVDDIESDFGEKVVVGGTGEVDGGSAANRHGIRLAQMEVWEENDNALFGPSTYDVDLTGDGLHFKTDLEITTAANRWWASLDEHYYSEEDGRGPQFSSALINADADEITITFDEDTGPILPASDIEGFRVTDDGDVVTISSAERVADNKVKLTLASAIEGTPLVSLGYGDTANGLSVPTDSTAYNLPAEIFIDESVSTDGTAPNLSSISANASANSATISWATNEAASSQIEYGLTDSYGTSTTEENTSTRVTSHSQSLSGLVSCTEYHYRALSTDAAGNQATGSDNTFTTSCTGDASTQESSQSDIATSGGSTSLTSGDANISLTVPNGFATSSATFQLKQIDRSSFVTSAGRPSGKTEAGNHTYNLRALEDATTTIDSFQQPINITMTYTDSDVSDVDESSLAIYRYDGSSWNELDSCAVDTGANTVTCETSQFSDFGLFGDESSGDSSSSSSGTSGGGIIFGCKDPEATNYDYFTRHDPDRCMYEDPEELTSVNTNFTRSFTVGDTHKEVRALQVFLNQNGFILSATGPGSPGSETDFFGRKTRQALAKYQATNSISPAVGYFGPLTRAHINGSAKETNTTNSSAATIAPSSCTFTRNLKLGISGSDVKCLQQQLNSLGTTLSATGPGSPGSETDFFGRKTHNAVIEFQEAYAEEILHPAKLTKGTGFVGPMTRSFLNEL